MESQQENHKGARRTQFWAQRSEQTSFSLGYPVPPDLSPGAHLRLSGGRTLGCPQAAGLSCPPGALALYSAERSSMLRGYPKTRAGRAHPTSLPPPQRNPWLNLHPSATPRREPDGRPYLKASPQTARKPEPVRRTLGTATAARETDADRWLRRHQSFVC